MTTLQSLPAAVDQLLAQNQPPAETLNQVVQIVGTTLRTDRCFLYVRRPDAGLGRSAFVWYKDERVPRKNAYQPDWQADTIDLPAEDPLIRAGLNNQPSVFVDDVEAAGPDVLNREFEAETFGHRALMHAHIQKDGQLWGILQPAVFGHPRPWTSDEKEQIQAILPKLQPVIAAFVAQD